MLLLAKGAPFRKGGRVYSRGAAFSGKLLLSGKVLLLAKGGRVYSRGAAAV